MSRSRSNPELCSATLTITGGASSEPARLLLLVAVLLFAGCDVKVPQTPHQKELREEQRLQSTLRRPDASVKKSPEEKQATVTVAMKRDPRHLNPALKIGRWGYRVSMYNIFEPLIRRNPKSWKLEPCLATRWSVSPDGRTYTFTIREGAQWHDGRPLTAQDVRFSLTRVVDGRSPIGPFRKDIRNAYKRVDTVGPNEVRLVLRTANSFLLDHLAEYPILPKHIFSRGVFIGSRGSKRPVGTGPYRFESRKRGKEIVLSVNKSYWGKVPDIRRIRFQLVEDWGKALTYLKRGELDILPDMIRQHYPSQLTPRVRQSFREVSFNAPGFSYILWNTRHPTLRDFRVRRAFTMLMDRERLIEEVHHGLARVVAGPYWRPSGLGDPKLKPWPFDPIEARNLLDKAGWRDRDGDKLRDKDGEPMRIVLMQPVGSELLKDELKILSAEFAKSGIELVRVPTDWPMMKRRLQRGRFMAAALTWSGRPAEDFSPLFHSAGAKNFGVIANLMLDRLLIRLRVTRNRAKRAPKSASIEQVLHSYQPCTFLHAPVRVSLVHRRLKNVHLGPDWFDFSSIKITPTDEKSAPEISPEVF